jgi:hypothetical protein
VDLIEVDVVGLEALEGGVDGVHDVAAGGADVVAAGTGAAEDLGGDDDVFAGDAEVAEGLADGDLGLAFGVDVGCIDEVDAVVDGVLDEGVDAGLADVADHLPDGTVFGELAGLVAGKGHGAEAELRNEEAGVAEGLVLHREESLRRVRR